MGQLNVTPVNNSQGESKAFGLAGKQYIPTILALGLSLVLYTSTAMLDLGKVYSQVNITIFCFSPTVFVLVISYLLLYNKPPNYAKDALNLWFRGGDANTIPATVRNRQFVHPKLRHVTDAREYARKIK